MEGNGRSGCGRTCSTSKVKNLERIVNWREKLLFASQGSVFHMAHVDSIKFSLVHWQAVF